MLSASGQGFTFGSLPNNYSGGSWINRPATLVDFGQAARTFGRVNFATVLWVDQRGTPCADAFSLKIYRPDPSSSALSGVYTVVADIGPFTPHQGYNSINLSGYDIEPGDVPGVTRYSNNSDCGSAALAPVTGGGAIYNFDGDPHTIDLADSYVNRWGVLAVRFSSEQFPLTGIIPVVGSVAGASGSNFRTAIQLTNPDFRHPMEGKLVFRPPGGGTPKELAYALSPGSSVVYSDIVKSLGVAGLGSIDVRTLQSAMPVISTRVFNDLGAGGTLGFSEPVQLPEDALTDYEYGYFITPADLANFRMNVGVRTLDHDVTLVVQHLTPSGDSATPLVEKHYAANSFEQVSLATFLIGTPVANGLVSVRVVDGAAIIYSATTDNRTNDSLLSFLTRGR